jgi:hypothetical protein
MEEDNVDQFERGNLKNLQASREPADRQPDAKKPEFQKVSSFHPTLHDVVFCAICTNDTKNRQYIIANKSCPANICAVFCGKKCFENGLDQLSPYDIKEYFIM